MSQIIIASDIFLWLIITDLLLLDIFIYIIIFHIYFLHYSYKYSVIHDLSLLT